MSRNGAGLPGLLGGPASDPETQTSQAEVSILLMIERLELAPGSTITERELGATLGLGKAPVREALARLVGTGLITPRTGSGYLVAPVTLREARSLFDLWLVLERLAVESYALPGVAARANEMLLPSVEEGERDQPGDRQLRDIFFHVAVASLSGNQPLFRALPYWEISRMLRLASVLGADAACSQDVHKQLCEALIASDVDRARGISSEHIQDLKRRVLDGLATVDQIQDMNLSTSESTSAAGPQVSASS